jgi:alpha-D-ribose 1-methylphosphonate 5-triphosphate diphosphatase
MHPQGYVVIENGRLADLGPGHPQLCLSSGHDVQGRLMTPGFVDLHSDAYEKCIEQRPGARFDPQFALEGLDRRLASSGVTTFCHAVAFLDTEMGLRSPQTAADITRSIQDFARSPRANIRHRLHIRFEVGSYETVQVIRELMRDSPSHVFSIMDHSPGQGQFRTIESFLHYYAKTYAISLSQAEMIGTERSRKSRAGWERSIELVDLINSLHIPILSHDDDSPDKVNMVRSLGAQGCEFPVSLEAAAQAKSHGMHVCMGAPNLLRGRSTNGNVTAGQVLEADLCDTLVSDYSPESLLQAPFYAHWHHGLDLAGVLAAVTSSPGDLLADDEISPGRLRIGAPADLVILDTEQPWVRVWETWVGGRRIYAAH